MRWDRFFEDLEDQLDSEWEAERAALDTEAERLRLSHVGLRDRLVALARDPRAASVHLTDDTALTGVLSRVGADWIAVTPDTAAAQIAVIPLWAVAGVVVPADAVLASVRHADPGPALDRRMSFGFVLRDIVRRRVAVGVQLTTRHTLRGTIDRAGEDHFDLALHDPGVPRRSENVTGYRLVPFLAVTAVRLAANTALV